MTAQMMSWEIDEDTRTNSSAGDEEECFCIRGTFIDARTTQWGNLRKTRSCSPPTSKERNIFELQDLEASQWVSSWIENAKKLGTGMKVENPPPPPSPPLNREIQCCNEPTLTEMRMPYYHGALNFPNPRNKMPMTYQRNQDAGILICDCGGVLKPTARFCSNCGKPRTQTIGLKKGSSMSVDSGSDGSTRQCSSQEWESSTNNTHDDGMSPLAHGMSALSLVGGSSSNNSEPECDEDITTLMICNIPPRLSIGKVVEVINNLGFQNTYDLMYLPRCKGRRVRSVFVNFTRSEFATVFAKFFKQWDSRTEWDRYCYTQPAHSQGYDAYLNMHSKRLESGCLLTFGAPTAS
jgi:hypothetical protein